MLLRLASAPIGAQCNFLPRPTDHPTDRCTEGVLEKLHLPLPISTVDYWLKDKRRVKRNITC